MKNLTVDSVAKLMADKIGHGMREKCTKHAEAVFDIITEVKKITAEECAHIALDLNDDGSWNGYHISRTIQETFGVNV